MKTYARISDREALDQLDELDAEVFRLEQRLSWGFLSCAAFFGVLGLAIWLFL